MSQFMMDTLSQQCNLETAEGCARMAELARPLLGAIPIGVYRDLLVARLAEEVHLGTERLHQLLQGPGRRRAAPRQAPMHARGKGPAESLISLLLHFPGLVADRDPLPDFAHLKEPRVALLKELFEMAGATPGISPVQLVERYRERPEHGLLAQLLAKDIQLSSEQAGLELTGGIAKMREEDRIRAMAARNCRLRPATVLSAPESPGELHHGVAYLPGNRGWNLHRLGAVCIHRSACHGRMAGYRSDRRNRRNRNPRDLRRTGPGQENILPPWERGLPALEKTLDPHAVTDYATDRSATASKAIDK